jgi:hypothetical protein
MQESIRRAIIFMRDYGKPPLHADPRETQRRKEQQEQQTQLSEEDAIKQKWALELKRHDAWIISAEASDFTTFYPDYVRHLAMRGVIKRKKQEHTRGGRFVYNTQDICEFACKLELEQLSTRKQLKENNKKLTTKETEQ